MWKWKYNMFNLPNDYKIDDHVKIWLGAKFGSCRYCHVALWMSLPHHE